MKIAIYKTGQLIQWLGKNFRNLASYTALKAWPAFLLSTITAIITEIKCFVIKSHDCHQFIVRLVTINVNRKGKR